MGWLESGEFKTLFDEINAPSIILVEEGVSLIAFVLIMILFWWTFLSFQNENSILSSGKIKYLCLISLLSFFFMSFISAMLLNNLVTQHLTLGMCRIIYPLYFIFYNIGKISIYCLASFRQQVIFNQDLFRQQVNLAISPRQSNIFRLFAIIIPSILWLLYIIFGYQNIEIIQIDNPGPNNPDYKYCNMRIFKYSIISQIILGLIGIFDTLFRLTTLTIFITKSINVTRYYKQNINPKKRDIINKLSKLMRKTNLLDITSIISTLLFLLGSAYILQQLIFFLIIDAVLCSLCTIALFQFGNKLYVHTCFKCEPFCVCLYCLEKQLYNNHKNGNGLEYRTFVDDVINKNSVHLKDVDTPTTNNNNTQTGNAENDDNVEPLLANNGDALHATNTTNTANTGIMYEATTTSQLNQSSTLIQAGTGNQNEKERRKNTAITMLSGHDDVEPKDLEITSDRRIEEQNNSLLSVTEFL